MLPTMMLGRFRRFQYKLNKKFHCIIDKITFMVRCGWVDGKLFTLNFEVTEPKLRPGGSGASVRILGMIDRLEPKVNLMSNNNYL